MRVAIVFTVLYRLANVVEL